MNAFTMAKLALAAIGVLAFFLGVSNNDPVLRWGGVAIVTLAFLLRFLPKRFRGRE